MNFGDGVSHGFFIGPKKWGFEGSRNQSPTSRRRYRANRTQAGYVYKKPELVLVTQDLCPNILRGSTIGCEWSGRDFYGHGRETIMARQEFPYAVKNAAIKRQGGKCAWCGIPIKTPWSEGKFLGNAHHLVPDLHEGSTDLDNCVYLCWGDHQLIGHGNAPFRIDQQGG